MRYVPRDKWIDKFSWDCRRLRAMLLTLRSLERWILGQGLDSAEIPRICFERPAPKLVMEVSRATRSLEFTLNSDRNLLPTADNRRQIERLFSDTSMRSGNISVIAENAHSARLDGRSATYLPLLK